MGPFDHEIQEEPSNVGGNSATPEQRDVSSGAEVKSPIQNASNRPLNLSGDTLPNVSDVIQGWFQPMIFVVITKTVVNYKVQELQTTVSFQGVWQPRGRKIIIDKIGQRQWKYFEVHSDTTLVLKPDDIITYNNFNYRVTDVDIYDLYGYRRYGLILDYQ